MMRNLSGLKSSLFVPQEAFELLIRRQIRRLEAPCLEVVELVEAELTKLCEDP
jgi:dynamin 1-like protein